MEEEKVIAVIVEKSGIDKKDIMKKIEEKEKEFSGLVSRMGAIHIVGKELGVGTIDKKSRELSISNVVSGMKSVRFKGKLLFISPTREFTTDKGPGKVCNLTLGDESGTIRLSLWGSDTQKTNDLEVGKSYEVVGGYTKEDNLGKPEARLGNGGDIDEIDDDIKVKDSPRSNKAIVKYQEKSLDDAEEGEMIEVKASLLQLYKRAPVHSLCSECNKKLEDGKCKEHKKVEPRILLVLSGIIDDGKGSMNAVFFDNNVENISGMNKEKIRELAQESLESFVKSVELGKDFKIKGLVRKNSFTNELELLTRGVNSLNIASESKKILEEVKA